jgi:hypothetical protein
MWIMKAFQATATPNGRGQMKPKKSESAQICVALFAAMFTCAVTARLPDTTLAELVQEADLVAYGETRLPDSRSLERSVSDGAKTVTFAPKLILKGADLMPGQTAIMLCNDPKNTEAYDLSKLPLTYFVFASKQDGCYQPILGVRSVVKVADGLAYTVAIKDQPERQAYESFIERIKSSVKK